MENLTFPFELFLVNREHQGVESEFLDKIKIGMKARKRMTQNKRVKMSNKPSRIFIKLPSSPTRTRLIYIDVSESFILYSFFNGFFHSI